MKRKFTNEQKQEIVKQYESGVKASEISRLFNCKVNSVYNIVSTARRLKNKDHSSKNGNKVDISEPEEVLIPSTTRYEAMAQKIKNQNEVIASKAIKIFNLEQGISKNSLTRLFKQDN